MKKNIFEKGPSYDDLFLLFLQMSLYYKSGNPILTTIHNLSNQTENSILRRSLKSISKDLEGGGKLDITIAKQKCFPRYCGPIIRAGEEAGELDVSLKEISYHMEQTSDIMRRIYTAVMPMLTALVIIIIALTIFLIYVNPFFQQMFSSLDIELPLINIVMLGLSNLLAKYWYMIIIFLSISTWGLWRYCKNNPIVVDRILLKIPIYKVIHYNFLQYKFVKIFKLLRGSGTGSMQAIELTADAIGNEIMAQMLQKTVLSMRNGFGLPQALEKNNTNKIMDTTVINLIRTGEVNGAQSLNESLDEAAKFYKKFVENKTERFGPQITPWILIPAFAVVMFIILSVQYPMLMMLQGV
jgi:type II secretory pathway component PulF